MLELPWRRVHFTGIGGVGMTGLALILRDAGVTVSGSDEVESRNLDLLRRRGCTIAVGHAAANLPADAELLVYSSAVQPDNPERRAAAERGMPERRRGAFLADLAGYFPRVVSVSGSHGKTSVSAMLSFILHDAGWQPAYLVGGDVADLPVPAAAGRGEILVTEVDESDGTQALMRNTHVIVTNVEDDHCWSVGGEAALYANFQTLAARSDCLVTVGSARTRELFADHPDATFLATEPPDLPLAIPGVHNRTNAALAVTVAERLGLPREEAEATVCRFRGVDRRMSVRHDRAGVVIVEDYAHHPTEVRATIQALRERWPDHELTVVLQPHRYERVLRYAADFARELSMADRVYVTPPFAAWLDDRDLADPRRITDAITSIDAHYRDLAWPDLAAELAAIPARPQLIAILGAGTISQLPPLLSARL